MVGDWFFFFVTWTRSQTCPAYSAPGQLQQNMVQWFFLIKNEQQPVFSPLHIVYPEIVRLLGTILLNNATTFGALTLQRFDTENSKQIFPEKQLRGLSLNFYIHVSVRDLYIPTIVWLILGIYKSLRDTWKCECGSWDWGGTINVLVIHKWDLRCSVLHAVHLVYSVSWNRQLLERSFWTMPQPPIIWLTYCSTNFMTLYEYRGLFFSLFGG